MLWFLYDSDGTRIGFTYNGEVYHYTTNAQGDVTGITDVDDNLVVEYSYDAWGKLLSTTGSMADTIGKANPFLYRGYYYDSETGLYYLNSRYYDPQTGRFINADDTDVLDEGQGSLVENNLFAYCLNNPVNMFDPDGEIAITTCILIGVGIGMLIGGGYGAASSYKKTGKVSLKQTVKWAFVGGVVGGVAGYSFGVAIGAAGAGGSVGLASQASRLARQAAKLTYSNTIKKHFATRAYYGSTQLLQQIMKAATPVKDASLKYGLKWLVPGSMAGSKVGTTVYGTWELVIDTAKNQIVHWLFKPNK